MQDPLENLSETERLKILNVALEQQHSELAEFVKMAPYRYYLPEMMQEKINDYKNAIASLERQKKFLLEEISISKPKKSPLDFSVSIRDIISIVTSWFGKWF